MILLLFARADKSYIGEYRVLRGQHDSRSIKGQKVKIKEKGNNSAEYCSIWVIPLPHLLGPIRATFTQYLKGNMTQGQFKVKRSKSREKGHNSGKYCCIWVILLPFCSDR